MSITRLGIKNFRCIKSLDLELPPLTVVVGPNGAGKSTLLGSFQLLSRLSRRKLSTAFVHYGGFDASLCWHSNDDDMTFEIAASTKSTQLDYTVVFVRSGNAHFVDFERLGFAPGDKTATGELVFRSNKGQNEWRTDDGQAYLAKVKPGTEACLPAIAPPNAHARTLVDSLRNVSHWSVSQLSLDAGIRKPQALQPATVPFQDGDNLLSVLYTMKTEQRNRYQELLESLQILFPEMESIDFPLAGKGYASLNWWQRGLEKPLDAQQLSDGTLRLLWLVTVLYTVPNDGLVLIDEPEISLHPQWLMVLAGLLRETSARTQIIVATHSDQLVRWLEPEELLLADMEDGISRFRWASEIENLADWLKDYTLDRLWLMGELGGRR